MKDFPAQRLAKSFTFKAFVRTTALLFWVLTGAAHADSLKVERIVFPVTLSNGFTYSVVGYLYHHGGNRHQTIQVLVHGGTYDHRYWDFPTINGRSYSYARYMVEQGYAVLALDLLGSGESDRPNGDLLTAPELASSLHQVMGYLRTGRLGVKHPAEKIVLVGHSMGASASVLAQSLFHDADALITTGLGHVPHELPGSELFPIFLQYEYFPLPPEMRAALFYCPPGADPEVIHYDVTTMAGLLSRGQLLTIFPTFFDPIANGTHAVTGPVLVQMGENDAMFPGTLAAGEAQYWASASSVTVQSLPGMGHDLNTHLNRETSWEQIDAWIQNTLGEP